MHRVPEEVIKIVLLVHWDFRKVCLMKSLHVWVVALKSSFKINRDVRHVLLLVILVYLINIIVMFVMVIDNMLLVVHVGMDIMMMVLINYANSASHLVYIALRLYFVQNV